MEHEKFMKSHTILLSVVQLDFYSISPQNFTQCVPFCQHIKKFSIGLESHGLFPHNDAISKSDHGNIGNGHGKMFEKYVGTMCLSYRSLTCVELAQVKLILGVSYVHSDVPNYDQ